MYLLKLAEEHGVQLKSTGYDEQFLELIETLGKEIPVAVLIDEYDKPIIDYLEQSAVQQALENREILKTFYAGVKDLDKYLRFSLSPGCQSSAVSPYSVTSIT